jgi:hypothetical protein
MIGEVSLFGVYVPALLLLGLAALVLAGLLSRLLQLTGFYRLIAYRPLVDLCLFTLILGLIVLLTEPLGPRP